MRRELLAWAIIALGILVLAFSLIYGAPVPLPKAPPPEPAEVKDLLAKHLLGKWKLDWENSEWDSDWDMALTGDGRYICISGSGQRFEGRWNYFGNLLTVEEAYLAPGEKLEAADPNHLRLWHAVIAYTPRGTFLVKHLKGEAVYDGEGGIKFGMRRVEDMKKIK